VAFFFGKGQRFAFCAPGRPMSAIRQRASPFAALSLDASTMSGGSTILEGRRISPILRSEPNTRLLSCSVHMSARAVPGENTSLEGRWCVFREGPYPRHLLVCGSLAVCYTSNNLCYTSNN
jgi:hypothetical protein